MLQREDVIDTYQELLLRPPESEEAILSHLASHCDVSALRKVIIASYEYSLVKARNRPRSSPEALRECILHPGIDHELLSRSLSGQYGMYLDGEETNTNLDAIRIGRPTGRFGNNFFQISNALLVAARLATRELLVPEMQAAFFKNTPSWQNVKVLPIENRTSQCALVGDFYAPFGFESFFANLSDATLSSAFRHAGRTYYSDFLRVRDPSRRRLCVHFRGGDIFAKDFPVHGYYVQPPASYYILAMEHALYHQDISEIRIVSEDRLNPALSIVEKHFESDPRLMPTSFGDVDHDIQTLIESVCVIASFSTFVEVACILSQNLESAYFFRTSSSQDMYKPFSQSRVGHALRYDGGRVYIIDDASADYLAPRTWANTSGQVEQIQQFPREKLRLYGT